MQETIYINDNNVLEYGVQALREYSVGGMTVTNSIFQGRNRSSYTLLASVYGRKPISFTLVYQGKTQREAYQVKALIESWMWGKSEIYLPNRFFYTCTLDSIAESVFEGQEGNWILLPVQYSLSGVQHDTLMTVPGENFINPGSLPLTDCSVSCTVSQAAGSYTLAGATFANVSAGEKLVVDGINKRILRNGAPAPGNVTFVQFPSVVPGINQFTAADPVTVEFYPSYL